jgi:hypothetical protein
VSKVEDGPEKFYKSPLFNRVINALARDADPLDLIDSLVTMVESTQSAYDDYVKGDTRTLVVRVEPK